MIINEPLIKSLLDNDLYTFTVGQVAFYNFSDVSVAYKFINRKNTPFPDGFDEELKHQIQCLSQLRLSVDEVKWLKTLPYLKSEYIDWLSNYTFDPSEVTVTQKDGSLQIVISGLWHRTIMFEVVVLALISELYFRLTNQIKADDWKLRIDKKATILSSGNCKWIDFGTRRRFDFETQQEVVSRMKNFVGFLGTSNCYMAYLYNVKPIGTMSHQFPMALSAIYGSKRANAMALSIWDQFYDGQLSIYLPDTFTTDAFLKDFTADIASKWRGLRQDSGIPHEWMERKVIPHYEKIKVSLKDKDIVFSDNLTAEKFCELTDKYRNFANIIGGIGTSICNDVGAIPLNIVIKLVSANNIKVAKLSDDVSKNTGDSEVITSIKQQLGIV